MSFQSVEICRITGKSKFIPKGHNYFPLLPPISPAEAKKLSQKPNYIPIYYLLKPPPTSFEEIGSNKAYQIGESAQLEYFYKIRDLVLLLPSAIEQLIVNGGITDMRIARDSKTVQIMRKNKQRWETKDMTLDFTPVVPAGTIKPGAGPSPARQQLTRRNVFEALNSNADQEELDALAKIEPDMDKVERLRKKFDRKNLKLGLEPTSTKATPSPFTFTPNQSKDQLDPRDGRRPNVPQTPSTPIASCQYLNGKLIPGQIMKTKTFGPRFIPGQLINVDGMVKPVFIPGQVLRTRGEGNNGEDVLKFIPGIVFEVNEDVHFVPGKVEKSDDGLKFSGSKIVSTDEGLHFVAEDMIIEEKLAQTDDSAIKWSILVQSFATDIELDSDEGSDDYLNIKPVKLKDYVGQRQRGSSGSPPNGTNGSSENASVEIENYSDLLNQEIQLLIESELSTIQTDRLPTRTENASICTNLVKNSIVSHRPSIQLKNFAINSSHSNPSQAKIQGDKNDDHRVSITELPQTPPIEADEDFFDSSVRSTGCLDSSTAKYKISVRPQKHHQQRSTSGRSSFQEESSQSETYDREEVVEQVVKAVNSSTSIPSILETSKSESKRVPTTVTCMNIVDELIETEKEFIQDIEAINASFHQPLLKSRFSLHADSIFGNLNDILDFHKRVLMEGLKYAADDEDNLPKTVGRTFMRLERDFDKHMQYYKHLMHVNQYLEENPDVKEFLEELTEDSKEAQLISQLYLPIQRLVDYKVILSDLNSLSPHPDLNRAVNFIETLEPSRNDDFLQSIEGFSGDLRRLGKLIKHDWFSVTQQATGKTQERYLFLFKENILVTKVRRVSPERSIFIAKDLIKLSGADINNVEFKNDHVASFELNAGTTKCTLQNVSTVITTDWFKHIKGCSSGDSLSELKSPKLEEITPSQSQSTVLEKNTEDSDAIDEIQKDCSEIVTRGSNSKKVTSESETPVTATSAAVDSSKTKSPSKDEIEISSKELEEKVTQVSEEENRKNSLRRDSSVINVSQKRSESKPSMAGERRSSISELILSPVKSTQVEPGDSATFHVKTRTSAVVTWLKDNRTLDDRLADRVKITSLQNVHKLDILNCRDEDSGLYSARVVDPDGTKQALCSGQLVVHELTPEERKQKALDNKPSFVVKFPDTELIESSTVCLMIHAKGDPDPQLQIFKDGKLLKNDDNHVFDGEELIIHEVKPEDGGTYKCVAKNVFGSDEFQADIKVVVEKQLKMPDDDDTSADACFQWFKDGHIFSPEERFRVHFRDEDQSLALLFQHVDPGDAGLYTCVGTTSSGRISCSAELTVQGAVHQLLKEPKAPCVISELSPIEVNLNGSAMLELKVDGFPRPTLKWYHKDSGKELDIFTANYKLIQENEDVTLIIKNVEKAHAGQYKVVASNELGVCESKCMMTIKSPPTFSKKLEEVVNVLKDAPLKLEAKVECSPAPTIKWYKDGKIIQANKHFAIEGSTLTISKSELQDAGSYSITASNELGQMAQFTTVNVNEAAKITKSLQETTVKNIGEDVEFEIEVSGEPEPKVVWEINGKAIEKSKKYEIKSDGRKHKLIIKGLVGDDSCSVKVKVSNEHGTDESGTQLKINRPPKITGKLRPVIVNLGDSATFDIKVDAYPAPKVKWWLGDVEIDSKKYGTGDDGASFSCKIPNVEASGTVKVKVSNDYGTAEDEAQLTVKCKPTFKKGLKDITIVENETLDVQIELKGSPEPQVTFFHNGNEVTTDARIKIKKTSSESYHMTFNVVLPSDAGKWKCVAANELGEVSSECTITVEGVPRFEKRLEKTIEVYETENLEVQVSVSGIPRPILKWYLNSTELKQSSHISIIESDSETEIINTLRIKEITLDEVGELMVTAENSRGLVESRGQLIVKSEPKRPIITTKLESVVAEKGTNVELVAKVKCSLTPKLQWFKDDVLMKEGILQNDNTCRLQLQNITENNLGQYSLKASTEFGDDESKAKIDVVYKPVIEQLRPVNIGIGEERTIAPTVKANPPAKISWFNPAGEELKDAELKVFGEPGQDGVYKVVAVNKYGQDEATVKVIIKMTPPEIIQGLPRRHGIKEGEDLILKLQVSGSPLPTVAWLKDGEPVKPSEAEMSMSPDGVAMLIVRNAKPGDAGKYTAVITNPNGEISCPCQVEIERAPQKPEFLDFPKEIELEIGSPLKLQGHISGFPDPNVKWYKEGEPLKPSAGILTKYKDGVLSLELKNPTADDIGRYTAILSNPSGETRQDVQVLPPTTAPKFTTPLSDIKVMEGYPYELEATVSSNPPPKLSLLSNGEISSIPLEIKTLEDGSLKATVAVPKCLSHCQYTLVAQNAKGSTESSMNVSMVAKKSDGRPPKFIVPLKDLEVDEGTDLKLEVSIEGCPTDVLWWNCDEVEIPGHFDGERASLKVPCIKMTSSGKYKCRISNDMGEDECSCNVIVRKAYCVPSFLQKLVNMQQIPKRDCKFTARIAGLPSPSVSWFKDGKQLQPSDKYIIKRVGDDVSLTVANCEPGDAGTYSCRLRSKEGEATCDATLQVVDKVEPTPQYEAPYFLKTIGNTEVMLGIPAKFTACVSGLPHPDFFWYHKDNLLAPSDRIQMQREGAGLLRLVINKPQESDLGPYRLMIKNIVGEAECAGSLTLDSFESKRKPIRDDYKTLDKTKPGIPNPLPDAPIISVMTDRRLTLSWKPSLPSNLRLPVTYTIEMCECRRPDVEEEDGEWFTVRSRVPACISDIHNLTPGRDYKFRIRVENKFGLSDPSPYAKTLRSNFFWRPTPWLPKEAGSYDLSRPDHDGYTHAPRFLGQDSDTQYLEKGINGSLRWWVYGYPKPTISITNLKTGQEIPLEPYNFTYRDNGEVVHFIKRMCENDVGEYEAVAKNAHGEARQTIKLAIGEHPKFLRHVDETFIFLHKSGKLTARVFGVPMPKIGLFKDWLPLATSARIKMNIIEESENTALISLSISDSISKDYGMYSIQATNCIGSASSSAMVHIDVDENEFNWHSYRPTLTRPKTKPFNEYYDVGEEIGRGTQGITYHLTDRMTGRAYAGKRMLGERWREEMRHERSMLEGLNQCQYISRMVDSFEDSGGVWIVQELCGRELVDGIELWSERLIKIYVRQILIAVDYLHELRIAHLGLNLRDILLAHDIAARRIKIIDFGLARHIGRQLHPLLYGQPEFVSPEIANGQDVGFGADIWAIGIITHLLLTGRSPFRGQHDMETLTNIQRSSDWSLNESYFRTSSLSIDFVRSLLRFNSTERPDIKICLSHPWLLEDDYSSDSSFDNSNLKSEYNLLKLWYKDANCRDTYRRKPLSGAFTHPSRMVYPPGEDDHERSPYGKREPRDYICPEPAYPRPDLDIDIDGFKSESHYQSGPDTYLLQLRDPDFPARLRQYMKVASNRSPALALQLKGTAYDRNHTVIRERRRFTDVMDEEVDDERKTLIAHSGPLNSEPRRLRHELGARINAEKDALLSVKREGKGPFIREKPDPVCDVANEEFSVHAVVDSAETTLQWFKNDVIMPDLPGHKQSVDETGLIHTLYFKSPKPFDAGVYKILAINKFGQIQARFRINTDEATSFHQKPSNLDYSLETQTAEPENGSADLTNIIHQGSFSSIGFNSRKELGVVYKLKYNSIIPTLVHVNLPSPSVVYTNSILYHPFSCEGTLLDVLVSEGTVSEQTLSVIVGQILDALKYLHWRGYALLNLDPSTLLLNSCRDPRVKVVDFSELQRVSPVGSVVSLKSNELFELQAPELQSGADLVVYHQTDIWSVGVLLYVLLSGVSPFRGENDTETRQNIQFVRYRFEHLYKDITQEATRFLMAIFKKCPMNRPNYDECFEHRWLSVNEFVIRKKQGAMVPCSRLREYAAKQNTGSSIANSIPNGDV